MPQVAAGNVFDHLKLVNVRLVNIEANLIVSGARPDAYEVQMECSVAESTTQDHVHANSAVTVLGRPKEDADSQSRALIKVEYQCVYLVEGIERSALKPHGNDIAGVAAMVAWPYLREMVHSITAKMGINPFALPMLMRAPGGVVLAEPAKRD